MVITYEHIMTGIIAISIAGLVAAIIGDFFLYDQSEEIKTEKKSIVATGSMFMFYFIYLLFVINKWGMIEIENETLKSVLLTAGTLMISAGSAINIIARLQLKSSWANHIRIYEDQKLLDTGTYGIVRHPLYASLMLMFFGGAIAYANWLCATLTALVFIPFMYYRAKQEEVMLEVEFDEYKHYKKTTGMFFPKFKRLK